jgi:hypothetical protein
MVDPKAYIKSALGMALGAEGGQEQQEPLNAWDTTRCNDAAQILLTSDAPSLEDEAACDLLRALNLHIRRLDDKLFQMAIQSLTEEREEQRENAPWRHPCPFAEEQPCDLLTPSGTDAEAIDSAVYWKRDDILRVLPCDRCRRADRDAEQLPGTRLGRLERTILLSAADAGARGERAQILPDDASPAERVATFRALRKLRDAGLVRPLWRAGRVIQCKRPTKTTGPNREERQYDQEYTMRGDFREVALTPLGEAVVSRLRPALESGKPVRWGDLPREALAAIRGDLPTLLVMATGRFLAKAYQYHFEEEHERREVLRPTYALLRCIETAIPDIRQSHREELTAAFLDQLREFTQRWWERDTSVDNPLDWLASVLARGFCDPPLPAKTPDTKSTSVDNVNAETSDAK